MAYCLTLEETNANETVPSDIIGPIVFLTWEGFSLLDRLRSN